MPKYIPHFFIITLLLASCGDSDNTETLETIDEFERETISKIASISDASEDVWDGFDLIESEPVFIIFNEPTTEDPTGYIINPPGNPPNGSLRLTSELASNLDIYRNDDLVAGAIEALGEGRFSFDYDVDGDNYFLIRFFITTSFYDSYKNRDNNWLPVVLLHELFHVHQQDMTRPANAVQDFFGFPFTEDLIAHLLLLWDIMDDAYDNSTTAEFTESLGQYLAIREKVLEIDPSPDKLAHNNGTSQEWLEGGARYIEYYSALNSIDPTIDQDPTQGWSEFLDNVTDDLSIRQVLVQREPYHVGAVVIHMLRSSDVNVESLMTTGQTPYDITKAHLDLSNAELSEILENLKGVVDWASYQERAAEIFALL